MYLLNVKKSVNVLTNAEGKYDLIQKSNYFQSNKINDILMDLKKILKIKFVIIDVIDVINIKNTNPNELKKFVLIENVPWIVVAKNKNNTYKLKKFNPVGELIISEDDLNKYSTEYFLNYDIQTCATGYDKDETNDDITNVALIVRKNGEYLIPYNSFFNTLLYTTNQLNELNIDVIMWYFCILLKNKDINQLSNYNNKMVNDVEPPALIKMYNSVVNKLGINKMMTGGAAPVATPAVAPVVAPVSESNLQSPHFTDKYNIKKAYTKDSKLSYYVVIDLTLSPGTSINAAQKVKLACQKNADNVRREWSKIWGFIYVPTPLFINNSLEEAKGDYGTKVDKMIEKISILKLLKDKNYNNIIGDNFLDLMKKKINTSTDFKYAFTNLRIASEEYDNLLKNHKISTEDLNNLITEAKYLK